MSNTLIFRLAKLNPEQKQKCEAKFYFLTQWIQQKKELIFSFFQNKNKPPLLCRIGEVYFANLGVNIGFEIDKNRPVVVFQGIDFYTKNSDMVFVFPITSNIKKNPYKTLFTQRDILNRKMKEGGILVNQGRSISKTRLLHKIAEISPSVLTQVQNKFQKLLYKNTTLEEKISKGDTRA